MQRNKFYRNFFFLSLSLLRSPPKQINLILIYFTESLFYHYERRKRKAFPTPSLN